jgi:hypothetical protein
MAIGATTLSTPLQALVVPVPAAAEAEDTFALTVEHRPTSPYQSSDVCEGGGQIVRPFGRDVAQSRDATGCHGGKARLGHHRAKSVEDVVHLRSTVRRADNALEKSNPRRTDISDARPSARPQHPKRLAYRHETMVRRNVMEGQT